MTRYAADIEASPSRDAEYRYRGARLQVQVGAMSITLVLDEDAARELAARLLIVPGRGAGSLSAYVTVFAPALPKSGFLQDGYLILTEAALNAREVGE